MRRPVSSLAALLLVLLLVLTAAAACSGSDRATGRSSSGTASLGIPAGTTAAQVTDTLAALRRRLSRLGVAATVRPDLSQIELRLLAHFSKDPLLVEAVLRVPRVRRDRDAGTPVRPRGRDAAPASPRSRRHR